MLRVRIYGAGSIGNHLAHASRRLGWHVTVCDISADALGRMKNQIYPSRYGSWDAGIRLCLNDEVASEQCDLVLIGTPPEFHLPLALRALRESPRALVIEKPLCTPSLEFAQAVYEESQRRTTRTFVGYDHVVGKAARAAERHLTEQAIGDVLWIDVEFREHWEGIFKAHPWLDGPADSYLGYWRRGGGASGEHSHALNLWQHLAHVAGKGRVTQVDAQVTYESHTRGSYDSQCFLHLCTEKGLVGRVVQDVVTRPPVKRARLQGTNGSLELIIGMEPNCDAVILRRGQSQEVVEKFSKTRPDDFIAELQHVEASLNEDATQSPISLARGLDTMLVIAAAHKAEAEQSRMEISYLRGYVPEAVRRSTASAGPSCEAKRLVA